LDRTSFFSFIRHSYGTGDCPVRLAAPGNFFSEGFTGLAEISAPSKHVE
jgi:hypothetical protein